MSAPVTSLALEQNLALLAGAGAGKTYSLVTLCLHLLGGARSDLTPVRPHQLFMLTFTDKAAAEMRARLRQRLDLLATGASGDAAEPELRGSFARLDRAFPPPDFWRRVRDDLGSATIGTFHSLCVQLLRRAPAGFGVDPGFELLEERAALSLIRDLAERVVLEALQRDDHAVAEICRELSFAGVERATGLVDFLCGAFSKSREEGLDPAAIEIGDAAEARADFERALADVKRAASEASAADFASRGKYADAIARAQAALDGMTFESFVERGRAGALVAAVESYRVPGAGPMKPALAALKYGVLGDKGSPGLRDFYAGCLVVRHEEAFRRLASEVEARHRDELSKRGVMDFAALLIRTRDLLRDHPQVRKEVQERMRALLVDEFQDTNRLQLELVTLLAERRHGAPRALKTASDVASAPLEPAFLCAVGDRKQSIYEFRGADVSVFGELAARIEREGGRRDFLKRNWRSTPGLLTFFNRLFAGVMAAQQDPRDYEVVYVPDEDDLDPVRAQPRPPPCVDRLIYEPAENAEESRALDAEGVARRLRQLLSGDSAEHVVGRDGALRRARGGDVAILLRRFTHLEVYRQALTRAGIPHRVVRGRGFYGAQEVLDVASLLALIADPRDALSFAAVLRSPLVALSDAALVRLALAFDRRLTVAQVLDGDASAFDALAPGERARLARFLELYPRLRGERDRLGVRVLIKVALEELGYRVAVAGTAYGEQALANLGKLLDLAGRWDERRGGDCSAFARELLALADADPNEAQADILDADDERAVQVMTIHQAKGLEWPIVVVPDLAAQQQSSSDRVLLDRERGLAMKPFIPDDPAPVSSPRYRALQRERRRRDDAEFRRLLYVAVTRARDHLVLSGVGKPNGGITWRRLIDTQLELDATLSALVRDLRVEELPDPTTRAEPVAVTPDATARVDRAIARARAPVPLRPSSVVLPVTHLQNYFLCPRRYLYAHQVGLSEYPIVLDFDREASEEGGDGRSAHDRRLRGTVAHRLLEQVDLSLRPGAELDEQLASLLWNEGLSPKDRDAREILSWVKRFLATPFAERLARAGPGRVHRELPFLLRLGGRDGRVAVHVKGQIDLLFEDEQGGATVIDYKASQRRPGGLTTYAFQLDCYALAARHFVQAGVAVSTGIAFLREDVPGPDFRDASSAESLADLEERLVLGAEQLLASSRTYDWAGREPNGCASIRCGYMYRCHPATPAL